MPSGAQDLQLRELKDTVLQLKTMLAEQTELVKSLRETVDQKTEHEKVLQEQIDYLTKKLFGRTSEERVTDIPGQLSLFDEAEQEAAVLPEPETVIVKEHTRKAKATHQDISRVYRKSKRSFLWRMQIRFVLSAGQRWSALVKSMYAVKSFMFQPDVKSLSITGRSTPVQSVSWGQAHLENPFSQSQKCRRP